MKLVVHNNDEMLKLCNSIQFNSIQLIFINVSYSIILHMHDVLP
jgi:hypothetical protein